MAWMRIAPVLILIAFGTSTRAADPADSPEFFEKKIRPVIVEHCHKCHGDTKGKAPKGGLRLDSRAAILKGGDNGTAIVVGNPDKSLLIEAVRYKNADMQMPPKGKLPDDVIADLAAWIKMGAHWPNVMALARLARSSADMSGVILPSSLSSVRVNGRRVHLSYDDGRGRSSIRALAIS